MSASLAAVRVTWVERRHGESNVLRGADRVGRHAVATASPPGKRPKGP